MRRKPYRRGGNFIWDLAGDRPLNPDALWGEIDPARTEHQVFRNASSTELLTMLVSLTRSPAERRRSRLARHLACNGLQLIGNEQLLLIANKTSAAAPQAVFLVESTNDWARAQVTATRALLSHGGTAAAAGVPN
jgi:hypothetical protein